MLSELRRPFDEYSPPEQAPLAGYGAAMLAYGVALSLALALARRTRTRPGWADVAFLGVGTHKLSRLITKDFVTAPLRAPFTRRKENEGAGEVHDEPRGGAVSKTIGTLLTFLACPTKISRASRPVGSPSQNEITLEPSAAVEQLIILVSNELGVKPFTHLAPAHVEYIGSLKDGFDARTVYRLQPCSVPAWR